jgi:hypothetical protein
MDEMAERVDSHVEQQVRRELAQQRTSVTRADRRPIGPPQPSARFSRYGFAGFTVIAAIPLSAIAAHQRGHGRASSSPAGIVGVDITRA